MFRKRNYILLGVFLLTVGLGVCRAAIINKIFFPDSYEVKGLQLALRGGGFKRYYGFKIWTSCLYVEKDIPIERILDDNPKRIEVHYLLDIPGAEIGRATVVGMENNISPEKFEKLENKIAIAKSYFPNVTKGDKYLVTYIPGVGTEFTFNGKTQGIIQGKDFAFAFFSVWIGEKPIDRKLRKKMLGIIK